MITIHPSVSRMFGPNFYRLPSSLSHGNHPETIPNPAPGVADPFWPCPSSTTSTTTPRRSWRPAVPCGLRSGQWRLSRCRPRGRSYQMNGGSLWVIRTRYYIYIHIHKRYIYIYLFIYLFNIYNIYIYIIYNIYIYI